MRTLPSQSRVFVFAAIATGAGLLVGFAAWPQLHVAVEFAGLILAAILTSALALRHSITDDRTPMPLSFVIDFTSLLLLGPDAAMLVATAGTISHGLMDSERSHPYRRMFLNAATVIVAIQAAGLAHLTLGGTIGHFVWPWQGVPLAAAVVVYCFVRIASAEVIVPLCNDTLERIMDCPRERALGRSLVSAVPVLAKTELPRAINAALTSRSPGTLTHLGLPSAAGARILQVKILPVVGGVTLLWHDVTERTRAEDALKRSEERFSLAAEGANDGMWEWDLRSQECYFSKRWKAMIGVQAPAGIGRPDEWFERVHAEDIGPLKEALAAHLNGQTDHFQQEHRIRHEDGTYRRAPVPR